MKKITAILLTILLVCSLGMSAYATESYTDAYPDSENLTSIPDNAEYDPDFFNADIKGDQEEQLFENSIDEVTISDAFEADVLQDDASQNITSTHSDELLDAYKKLSQYISDHNLAANVSLETFEQEYLLGEYSSISEYLEAYYSLLDDTPSPKWTGDTKWYYNTGTTLMDKPNYNSYNLLNVVQAGDIVYEDEGGSGLTGHTAIVEGIYYDATYSTFYVRVVEAIGYLSGSIGEGDGVCRGVLDDTRYLNRGGMILRVTSANNTQKTAAVNFCVNQIGKGYNLDVAHDTSSNELDWYCSELVWAAYKNQGIDLETSSNSPGITPRELRDSTLTSSQTVSSIGTPTITSITSTNATSAKISWSSVSGATKYYIYRASSISSGSYSLVSTTTSTSYTNSGLTSGSTYYYRVAAYKSGLGNKSQPAGVKLSFSAPVITKACPTGTTSVSLSWDKVYNATGYYVYRSTSSSGTYSKIATVSGTSYSNSGLTSGTTYYYKVAAYNSSSTSSLSGYKSVMPTSCQTPTIYYGTANSTNSITIKWTNVPNATSYYVYRSSSASGTYTKIATVNRTSYNNTGLSSGTTYYYKVVAYNSSTGKTSPYSGYKSVRTL